MSGQKTNGHQQEGFKSHCGKCGAQRIDKQIGLEPTPEAYVAAMVQVFREIKRVLKPQGTVWANFGDSYNTSVGSGSGHGGILRYQEHHSYAESGQHGKLRRAPFKDGLKPKDLIGIPWAVAFALRADGWYLRSDIIWSKPNPMPESVTDRPTKAHEYLFLLAKGQSRTRRVLFANLNPERVHFGLDFGKQASGSDVVKLCVSLASAFFYAAQLEDDFGLPPFYSEVWVQRSQGAAGDLGSSLPAIHRLAAHAARFLNADASTKEFLCEVQRIWSDLGERDHLLIGRGLAECAHAPSVLVDGNAAVTVNHAGQIRKIEFLHGSIIDTVTTTCDYFYDAQAIAEPVSAAMLQEMEQGYDGLGLKDYEAAGVQNPSSVKARIIAKAKQKLVDAQFSSRRMGLNRDVARAAGLYGQEFGLTRNKRTVWSVNTQPYQGAHFATMPEALVEPCILAGAPLGGLVLDPFVGSGTVVAVAQRLGRRGVGVDLSYQQLAKERTAQQGIPFGEWSA